MTDLTGRALRAVDRGGDRTILIIIAIGIIAILLGTVAGIFLAARNPPLANWAENVLIALVTGALLKLSDVVAAVVALSSGRQNERLSNQLAAAPPPGPIEATIINPPNDPVQVESS